MSAQVWFDDELSFLQFETENTYNKNDGIKY